MTHSLHREGTRASLMTDYVVLALGNDRRKLVTPKAALSQHYPRLYALIKGVVLAVGMDRLLRWIGLHGKVEEFKWSVVLHSKEQLVDHLTKLKEAQTGQSVVVSGLIEEVNGCLDEVGLTPHTVQFSLGRLGKTDELPSENVLEITSMCGHHLVSPMLVEKLASDVADGKISSVDAVETMGGLCHCAIFNKSRAQAILSTMKVPDAD